MMDVAFLMLAATRPWALGALISILGFGGLAMMLWNRWYESDTGEGLTLLFGLMAAGPILCLLPDDFTQVIADLPFNEEILCGLCVLVIAALWAGLHFLMRYMRRIRHERPQRQGRCGKKGRR